MSASEIENLIGFIAAVAITVYLIYALVRPEKL